MSGSLTDSLRRISPRPWKLIYDVGPARDFATGKRVAGEAPVSSSFRIVDAENRLLVRIQADPEQTLRHEDMAVIVEAINAL